MTPTEFRASLSLLGLTQQGFARLSGQDDRTIRRYVSGERAIPEPVARLLWAMKRDRTLIEALAPTQANQPTNPPL